MSQFLQKIKICPTLQQKICIVNTNTSRHHFQLTYWRAYIACKPILLKILVKETAHLLKPCSLLSTILLTITSAERSFSKLELVKNDLPRIKGTRTTPEFWLFCPSKMLELIPQTQATRRQSSLWQGKSSKKTERLISHSQVSAFSLHYYVFIRENKIRTKTANLKCFRQVECCCLVVSYTRYDETNGTGVYGFCP